MELIAFNKKSSGGFSSRRGCVAVEWMAALGLLGLSISSPPLHPTPQDQWDMFGEDLKASEKDFFLTALPSSRNKTTTVGCPPHARHSATQFTHINSI